MRIWFDVSGIYNWQGSFTGIQRVVYNLAYELHAGQDDAHYFIYRPSGFHEVSFEDLQARLQRNQQVSRQPMAAARRTITIAKIRHKSLVVLKDNIRGTSLEPHLKKAYKSARNLYRSARSTKSPTRAAAYPFARSDVVIVVDGNWQFSGYAELMAKAVEASSCRLVHFVHDLVAVKNPALANTGADKIIGDYLEKIFAIADTLIAVSESTQRDIEWFLRQRQINHRPTLATVILGDNISTGARVEARAPAKVPATDFILSVSTIEVRKNYLSLYYAYRLAGEKNIEMPPLVIVGRKGWMADESYTLLTVDPEIKKKITVLQGVTDGELVWLYQNCLFTVFPSFYEGWGLPVAESLTYGKCCISSNTSSMPEVAGELAQYVSPYDPAELMNSINKLSSDKAYRQDLEKAIAKSYLPHTWSDTYEDMMKAL